MKVWSGLLAVGSIVTILGITFHFQGMSVIGPKSSFMYANSDWVFYGLAILILGIIIVCLGITIKYSQGKKST